MTNKIPKHNRRAEKQSEKILYGMMGKAKPREPVAVSKDLRAFKKNIPGWFKSEPILPLQGDIILLPLTVRVSACLLILPGR